MQIANVVMGHARSGDVVQITPQRTALFIAEAIDAAHDAAIEQVASAIEADAPDLAALFRLKFKVNRG
jgi:hypothetical protein